MHGRCDWPQDLRWPLRVTPELCGHACPRADIQFRSAAQGPLPSETMAARMRNSEPRASRGRNGHGTDAMNGLRRFDAIARRQTDFKKKARTNASGPGLAFQVKPSSQGGDKNDLPPACMIGQFWPILCAPSHQGRGVLRFGSIVPWLHFIEDGSSAQIAAAGSAGVAGNETLCVVTNGLNFGVAPRLR